MQSLRSDKTIGNVSGEREREREKERAAAKEGEREEMEIIRKLAGDSRGREGANVYGKRSSEIHTKEPTPPSRDSVATFKGWIFCLSRDQSCRTGAGPVGFFRTFDSLLSSLSSLSLSLVHGR